MSRGQATLCGWGSIDPDDLGIISTIVQILANLRLWQKQCMTLVDRSGNLDGRHLTPCIIEPSWPAL
jgi:hypothetical protein